MTVRSTGVNVGRKCNVCRFPLVQTFVNEKLTAGVETCEQIASATNTAYGPLLKSDVISEKSVARHKANHLPSAPEPPKTPMAVAGKTTFDQTEFEEWRKSNRWETREDALRFGERLGFQVHKLLEQAEAAGDLRLKDSILKTASGLLSNYIAKVSGLIDERPTTVSNTLIITSALADQSLAHVKWLQRWLDSGEELPEPPLRALKV